MAIFQIEFEEFREPGPTYEDYSVGVNTICNDDAQQRNVMFNDIINGDFVVGYNYSGNPATTLVIESYEDHMDFIEIATSIATPDPGFTPSELRDTSTGNALTYPYTKAITNLNQLDLILNSSELSCPPSSDYTTVRTRRLVYHILDDNGTAGPTRTASFTNNLTT